jgi:hypothetical protein
MDAFLVKLNSVGNFVAAQSYGTSANESVTSIARDSVGNVYIVGGSGTSAGFVARFTFSCQFVSAQTLTAVAGMSVTDIATDPIQPGRVHLVGVFAGAFDVNGDGIADFDTGDDNTDLFWIIYGMI